MVFPKHVHDLLRLVGFGKRSEPSKINEYNADLTPVALQGIFGIAGDNDLSEMRRKKTLQPLQPLELQNLFAHPRLQCFVPVQKLRRLVLDGVMKLFNSDQRANPSEKFWMIRRLAEEIVGAGLDTVDQIGRAHV